MKLLETQTLRDIYVITLIIYFLSLAALLRSESFWLLSLSDRRLLVDDGDPAAPEDHGRAARTGGRACAMPAGSLRRRCRSLRFWLFFPRFDGPLWRMPDGRRSAETGLSDSMSPGDITDLALSDEVAFRVHFNRSRPAAPGTLLARPGTA